MYYLVVKVFKIGPGFSLFFPLTWKIPIVVKRYPPDVRSFTEVMKSRYIIQFLLSKVAAAAAAHTWCNWNLFLSTLTSLSSQQTWEEEGGWYRRGEGNSTGNNFFFQKKKKYEQRETQRPLELPSHNFSHTKPIYTQKKPISLSLFLSPKSPPWKSHKKSIFCMQHNYFKKEYSCVSANRTKLSVQFFEKNILVYSPNCLKCFWINKPKKIMLDLFIHFFCFSLKSINEIFIFDQFLSTKSHVLKLAKIKLCSKICWDF